MLSHPTFKKFTVVADAGFPFAPGLNASLSKPIIDDIDRVLARHYGFTDEELDFILNYDIKHRIGVDAGDDGDG